MMPLLGRILDEPFLLFTHRAQAKGNVDMFMMTKKDVDEVLKLYPDIAAQIKLVALERLGAVQKRDAKAAAADQKPVGWTHRPEFTKAD